MSTVAVSPSIPNITIKKKSFSWVNIALGAFIQTAEVSTLGQPFEVVKTHMAAHRNDSLWTSIVRTYQRGGIRGFYQGLIPWAWIEASTKGGVLLFASSEIDYYSQLAGASPAIAGAIGGMGGGIAQAYTTMGFCTFMKTVEVTRHKSPDANASSIKIAADIFKKEGIVGLNRGVSAVAVRQMTNWGSRFGISRVTESIIRGDDQTRKLENWERITSSVIGGALSCWNQPIEVIRVEMQSQAKAADRPEKMSISTTAKYIYERNGFKGFYRGVTPRICLSVYLTTCMVFGGDKLKEYVAERQKKAL
ncbi:mitochondrial carrier [Basidiobolus meristosporus CBS 931.73]|uniref:Mitochondrial carrier n=1 Tax=Basidiobolus meristosporus CBS 931.73 TaxID=1314790 RepID=A0A1Y1YXY0_9FUNG|nr:mitochondrial carrier [Basidiobolus meristosporus CBS 931.73]|eukprot:ORY02881.1 mitochondrial carrier [Basidiobolus meristosporus CBS 931.73]